MNFHKDTAHTRHSLQRIYERSLLSPFEVIDFVDKRLYVSLGTKPGISKEHLLIWSPKDQQHFVIIRDSYNGGFLTLMPVEYNPWPVAEHEKAKAKALFDEAPKPPRVVAPEPGASMLQVHASYYDYLNSKHHVVCIGKRPIVPVQEIIDMFNSEEFQCWMKEQLNDRGITKALTPDVIITLRTRKKVFHFQTITDF